MGGTGRSAAGGFAVGERKGGVRNGIGGREGGLLESPIRHEP